MKTQPIRVPGQIPKRQWKIKIPNDLGYERDDMKSFQAYEKRLEKLGFEKVYETKSFSHEFNTRHPETHSLWHHKAGVLVLAKSYTTGGYTKSDGTEEPVVQEMGSATAHAVVDPGMGPEVQHRGSVKISMSGGSRSLLDGRLVKVGWEYIHSNTRETLVGFLKQIQPYGRIIPLDEWPEYGGEMPHFPNEMLFPLEQPRKDAEKHSTPHLEDDKRLVAERRKKRLYELFSTLEPSVGKALTNILKADGAEVPLIRLWDGVEAGLIHYSEVFSLSNRRWIEKPESRLLKYWSEVALGNIPDYKDWKAEEDGPCGLSLIAMLASGKPQTGAEERLLELLEKVSENKLRQWCTVPDGGGFTLPLLLLRRLVTSNYIYATRDIPEDTLTEKAFEILVERVGADDICLETENRSALGLVLEFDPGSVNSTNYERILFGQGRFTQAIKMIDEMGIKWHGSLKWRSYPNMMMNEGRPKFFHIPGPASAVDFKHHLGNRWTDNLGWVYSWLRNSDLKKVVGEARLQTEERKTTGPRM